MGWLFWKGEYNEKRQQSAISNQQSAISNQQSAISNQQSAISNLVKCGGLMFAVILFVLPLGGCDLAKPQNQARERNTSETAPVATEKTPSAKETVTGKADTSLNLDQTFEEKDYGFRFDYPSTFPLEKGEGIFGMGKVIVWFSTEQNAMMTVDWMVNTRIIMPDTKAQASQEVKKLGGTLKSFEKTALAGKDCVHIEVAYGGMLDPRGSRISVQYLFPEIKSGRLLIEFSAPAYKLKSYRPQFNAVLKSFRFDNGTTEDGTAQESEK